MRRTILILALRRTVYALILENYYLRFSSEKNRLNNCKDTSNDHNRYKMISKYTLYIQLKTHFICKKRKVYYFIKTVSTLISSYMNFSSSVEIIDLINIQNARYIGDYYKIVGALINRYHATITMENAAIDLESSQ